MKRGELPGGQVWGFLGRKDRKQEAKSQYGIVRCVGLLLIFVELRAR